MKDRPMRPKKSGPPLVFKAGEHDPEVAARMEEANRKRDRNQQVIMDVLDALEHPAHRGKRDLVGILAGLMKHLTPEQAVAFAEKLPALLPAEAVAALASATRERVAVNGAT